MMKGRDMEKTVAYLTYYSSMCTEEWRKHETFSDDTECPRRISIRDLSNKKQESQQLNKPNFSFPYENFQTNEKRRLGKWFSFL
jgi:hypothetical protein